MSITSDNLAALSGYPLIAPGSVDNQNIQKLRTFSLGQQRRVFSSISFDSAASGAVVRSTKRVFNTVQIP